MRKSEREALRRLIDRGRRERVDDAIASTFLRNILENRPRRTVEVEESAKRRNPPIPLEALERAKGQLGLVEDKGRLRLPPGPRGPREPTHQARRQRVARP